MTRRKESPLQAPLPPDEEQRTAAQIELQVSVEELRQTVAQLKRTEEQLTWRTALMEAQANSSIDGILVLDQENRKIFQNQRMVDLLKIPRQMAENRDDEEQFRWVAASTKDPGQFIEKVIYLNSHPSEISRDEVELKDGTIFDRYSSPVFGKNGEYYGRIWTFRDITERKQTENALRENEERFRSYFELGLIGMGISSPAMGWIEVNDHMCQMLGYKRSELLQTTWTSLTHPDDLAASFANFNRIIAGKTDGYSMNKRFIRKDGRIVEAIVSTKCLRRADDSIKYLVVLLQDITERKRLEAQVFQSQKLETVGKLASGIAHEFNSILTAIIGQSELLLSDLPAESPLAKNAAEITMAANRAAALTRQLLAYGRKQMLRTEILDLNRVVTGMEGMFHHLMGGSVNTLIVTAPDLHAVKADAGQIEQVIMNMAVNAHDAMPKGGRLTLETANVSIDQDSIGRYPDMKPGGYVMLAITDTGAGMNPEVKARVFEPFFSTKDVGQGTGLGLSSCHGIIKQSGGHISVYSEPGRGATFKVYLPQIEQEAIVPVRGLDPRALPRGTETILLVEDDPALREMAATLLRRLGYVVWPAANGIEALGMRQQPEVGYIDLLFTDIVMPHMSGKELSDRVQASSPGTRTLFASAYAENAVVHHGVLDQGVALLQKPFTPAALAHKLREVLDQPGLPVAPANTENT